MGFNEFAAKAVRGISRHNAKKLFKNVKAEPVPAAEPEKLSGDGYACGYSVKEVMPADIHAKSYWIAGHGMNKTIDRIHDPVTVSAMWIGTGDGGIIMCSADVIGLTNVEVTVVRDSLKDFCAQTGCRSVNICCTHSHAGFDTVGYWGQLTKLKSGKDPEYMKLLLDSLAQVCREAYESRKPGKLFCGTVHVPEAQYDKREPVILHDVLTRLRFVPDDSSQETWFLNFAAHPNTLGGANHDCSADYPYYLRTAINREQPVNVLFGVGAIGAVDPGMFCEDKPERTRLQGEALAAAALSIDNDRELAPEITVLAQKYYSPVDNGLLAMLGAFKIMSTQRYPDDKGDLGLALKTELTYIRLGSLQILLLPGECFPEVVYGGAMPAELSATGKGPEINPKPLIDIAGDSELLVFGVTNDMTGYCVVPNDFVLHATQPYISNGRDVFDRSHYHETNSLGYLTNETIANVFEDVMNRVK